jgi:hypothetical protein
LENLAEATESRLEKFSDDSREKSQFRWYFCFIIFAHIRTKFVAFQRVSQRVRCEYKVRDAVKSTLAWQLGSLQRTEVCGGESRYSPPLTAFQAAEMVFSLGGWGFNSNANCDFSIGL